MLRGYRRIIVAFVGWLSLAAQHPNPTAQPQQAKTAQPVKEAAPKVAAIDYDLAERVHRAKYEAQCNPANEKRDSDLCAQWKAADAATDAARWTYIGNWIGGLSGLLVLIALGFAFEANQIARETAKQQLRAYVTVTDLITIGSEAEKPFQFAVGWKNAGATPAQWVKASINWYDFGEEGLPPSFDFPEPEDFEESYSSIGPGETVDGPSAEVPRWLIDAVKLETRTLFVWGWLEYSDVFKGSPRRRTEFALQVQKSGHGDFGIAQVTLHRHNGIDDSCDKKPRTEKPA